MARWLRRFGQLLLTGVVGTALVYAVDGTAVLDALQRARPLWLGVAVLLLPLNLALDGWVWARLLDAADGTYRPRAIGEALFCGFALGFWTPARLGEYAGRAYSFDAADRWAVTLSVLAQRVLDMLVGVGGGLVALLWALHAGLLPASIAWYTAAAIGGGTVVLLSATAVFPAWVVRLTSGLGHTVADFVPTPRLFARLGPRHSIPAIAGTVVRYVVFTGQFVCLSMALDPTMSVVLVGCAAALTFYAKYLLPSLTLLDLGLREGAAVFFFSVLGLPPAVALSAALLLFAMNVLLPALLGLPTVARLSVFRSSDAAPSSASA